LLRLDSDGLQAWDELVASGAAALAALQQAFGDLQPSSAPQELPGVLNKLKSLVGY
jgi:hypothetical protein